MLAQPGTKLMVIGYSFQDDHINQVICDASVRTGLGTFLVDPNGRDVLKDPKMADATIKAKREVEDIKIIGELKRPLERHLPPRCLCPWRVDAVLWLEQVIASGKT